MVKMLGWGALRWAAFLLAGTEVAAVVLLALRAGAAEEDWSRWEVWEAGWPFGILLAPALLALLLALAGRGLGWSVGLSVLMLLLVGTMLLLARSATVAG